MCVCHTLTCSNFTKIEELLGIGLKNETSTEESCHASLAEMILCKGFKLVCHMNVLGPHRSILFNGGTSELAMARQSYFADLSS